MNAVSFTPQWNQQRWAAIMEENSEKNAEFCYSTALQFYFGTIVRKKQYDLTPELIEIYSKYTAVNKDDIIINGLNLNYDFVSQRVGIVKEQGIITSAYLSMRVRPNYNPNYYCYLLKSLDARKVFHGMGTGIRLTLSYKELRNILLPVPSRNEQDQIVRFLDWKISSITKLISIKLKQVEKLKALKQSVVSHIITHGLNSDVKTKDSGVSWLGEIPSHWQLTKVKRKCKATGSGTTPATSNADYYNGIIPWIQSGDLYHTTTIEKTEKRLSELALQEYSALSVYPHPFLVIAMYGASIGNTSISNISACVNQACCVIIPTDDMDLTFMYYWLTFCKDDFIRQSAGGTQPNISQKKVREEIIVDVPLYEQRLIVEYLNTKCAQIDAAIEAKKHQINKIQELKERLIFDVVTGKIDVRSIKIPDYEYEEKIDGMENVREGNEGTDEI